jgi:hypothetical protein
MFFFPPCKNSFPFRLIQVFARRQAGVFFEMFGAQWLGYHMSATEPFAQVNQLATVRTKWTVLSGEPGTLLFARWTDDPGPAFIHPLFRDQNLVR